MSSRNKIVSFGPYTGMSYEEIVAADPWYIVDLHNAGGNHGISNSMFNRAERLIREYGGAEEMEAGPADDLYAFDGTSYLDPFEFRSVASEIEV